MADRERRKSTDVNLDQAPPPPPSLSGPTNQLDGILGQGPSAPGSDALSGTIQTAMQLEQKFQQFSTDIGQGLQMLSGSLPGFRPIGDQLMGAIGSVGQQFVNSLRQGVVKGLQNVRGQNPSPAPGAGVPNAPQPLQQSPQQQPQAAGGMAA